MVFMCDDSEGMMCDDSEGMMCLYTVSEESNRSVSELYSLLVLEASLWSYLKLHFFVLEPGATDFVAPGPTDLA